MVAGVFALLSRPTLNAIEISVEYQHHFPMLHRGIVLVRRTNAGGLVQPGGATLAWNKDGGVVSKEACLRGAVHFDIEKRGETSWGHIGTYRVSTPRQLPQKKERSFTE
jgi:hypothetical protein